MPISLRAVRIASLVVLAMAILLSSSGAAAQDSTPGPEGEAPGAQCSDGQLRVGDLQFMDEEWQRYRGMLDARANEWEGDSFMTALRVNCGILERGYRWSGTYYSPSQQAFFETDSGTAVGAEFDPDDAAELPADLKFGSVWRALIKAGYTDDTHLTATIGVSLQVNSEATPLGPGEVPDGATVCHVGLDHLGEIRDLFITIDDGAVYRHTFG